MNRFETSFSGSVSDSGVFCMEPEMRKENAGDHARWLKLLRELPDVRLKKVMEIREQIARGTYETDEKWQIAIARLLEDLRR